MKHFTLAITWAIIVLLLTCLPMESTVEKVPAFEGMDKLVHTGFFFVFAALLGFGYSSKHKTRTARWTTAFIIFVLAIAFAFLTELLQYFIFTYRSGDWWDIFADTVGTCMGLFAYLLLHRDFIKA